MFKLPDLLNFFMVRLGKQYRSARLSSTRVNWGNPFETLRSKWVEVPVGSANNEDRRRIDELLALSDDELLALWSKSREIMTTGTRFSVRGWYHLLYADVLRGRKVLDVGCGLAFDSITFAQHGAKVTFVDIVQTNLEIVRRLCNILGLTDVGFLYMKDIQALSALEPDFDVVLCMGSLHHAPLEIIRAESRELLKRLKIGGRWIQLAYPKKRWVREGRLPFDIWGSFTDGAGTPWAEWYDLPKLLRLLEPAEFDVILYHEFNNGDFNWFDLIRRK